MPRVYYCTLRLFVASDNLFNVRFQYIDKGVEAKGKDHTVFESEPLVGGFKKPVSYSEIKIFTLSAGKHNLYYRVISESGASNLHIRNPKMVCLSYNFCQ